MGAHVALGALRPVVWAELEAFARALSEFCKVHVSPDHVVTTKLEPGEIEIRWQGNPQQGEARLRIAAKLEAGLQNLRDTLAHMLETVRPGLSDGILWDAEGGLEGRLPPNFRLAEVMGAERISARFMRLTLVAEDLDYLNQNGLHLRLLQPKDAKIPAWPRLSANGRTLWPEAADLHKPVYTIREIDVAAGRLVVDVFIHGRGPTCAWAQKVQPGAEVGLTGPGGGWFPQGTHLCLGGDETALPVIARILEAAPEDAQGVALIEVADLAEIQPIAAPRGVRVDWLLRREGGLRAAYTAAALQALSRDPAAEVQFAGEKQDALAVRAALRDGFGTLPASVSCASYWVR